MHADVHLEYIDENYLRIRTEPGILMEIANHFTYKAEGYKYHPKFKSRQWDGNIGLVNKLTGALYAGLAHRVKKYCDQVGYTISFDDRLLYENISESELIEFIKSLNLPEDKEERDYQVKSILKCIRSRRRTLLSPTSSGKSLMIYVLTQWYKDLKPIIIVPSIGLVNQMAADFRDYGYTGTIATSVEGFDRTGKEIKADMVITTWQTLNNGKSAAPPAFYRQFGLVIGDEAHGCKAKSLIQILSCMPHVRYRFGTTGTLPDNALSTATIEGLFGAQYQAITTKQLTEQGYASKLQIKCIVLRYPDEIIKSYWAKKRGYPDEIEFLINHEPRTKYIANLVKSLDKNKLVFFRRIEHGQAIYSLLADQEHTFLIDGSVKGNIREEIRKAIEELEQCTLVASLGTTSTGVSVNRLKHMIAGHPSKSKIKVLQSIGRMLRKHADKAVTGAILYDIVDDLSIPARKNFTLQHFYERCDIYDAEEFDYKIYNVRL